MISKEHKRFMTSKMRELNEEISIINQTVYNSKRMGVKESSIIRSSTSRCEQIMVDIFFSINQTPKEGFRSRIIRYFTKIKG